MRENKDGILSSTRLAKYTAYGMRRYALSLLRTDLESAFSVANIYGNFLWKNYIGIYADPDFELSFVDACSSLMEARASSHGKGTLHLLTQAYECGGHTRVVEKLAEADIGTGVACLGILPELTRSRLPKRIRVHEDIGDISTLQTVRNIIEIGTEYDIIILHIHPDDIASSVAASILRSLDRKVYFYNHADHVFSFGKHSAMKVLEISKYGWSKGLKSGISDRQSYVGVPIKSTHSNEDKCSENERYGVMAGSAGKFRPHKHLNVAEFFNKLFKKKELFDCKLYIIGPSGKERWWDELSLSTRRNLHFLGSISHTCYVQKLSFAQFYIDSFPTPGGTAFPEAIIANIPSFGLDNLSGYSYADELRSSSIDELADAIARFCENPSPYKELTSTMKATIIEGQGVEVCAKRIENVIRSQTNIPLPEKLSSAPCIESFFEEEWTDQQIILPSICGSGPYGNSLAWKKKIRIISAHLPALRFLRIRSILTLLRYLLRR